MKPAKERIEEAFLNFLQKKPYDRITVSEVVRAANINRSSFYRCFADINDLYEKVCTETAEDYISSLPPFRQEGDAFRFILHMYRRASLPWNRERIMRLFGENGSGAFALILRRCFLDKIAAEAKAEGIWDERMQHLVTFSAEYMIVVGYYFLYAEQINTMPMLRSEVPFDYEADPIGTITQMLRENCGGSLDVHSALFLSTVRMFSEGDARLKPLSKLLSYSGFSRTIFYRIFNDKRDYFAKLEGSMTLLTVKAVLPLMLEESPEAFTVLLDLWEKYYLAVEQKALYIAFRDGYGFRIAACLVTKLHEAYIAALSEKLGTAIDEEARTRLSFFTCGVMCSLVYYYASLDREAFFQRMKLLFEIREKLLSGE